MDIFRHGGRLGSYPPPSPIPLPFFKGSVLLIVLFYSVELMFDSVEVMFYSIEVIFYSVEVMFYSVEVMFYSVEVMLGNVL